MSLPGIIFFNLTSKACVLIDIFNGTISDVRQP